MTHRCAGRCGRHVDDLGSLCGPCLRRLPPDLLAQLDDTVDQPMAHGDAVRWLRRNPERNTP